MATKILLWVSRILFGGIFIFAGFTKAIDPLGSAYKFEDYFLAFGMEGLFPLALPLAIALNSLELLVGFAILFALKMRYSAWAGLLFMAFFTPLTLYIAITNPVPDCGCFGDAIIISNWETFYKNVVFLAAAILLFINRNRFSPVWSFRKDWYIVGGTTALILWLSFFCLRNLPIIDFRPWKVGNDISEQVLPVQEGEVEYTFIYDNTETGERREFSPDSLPFDQDEWVYADRKEIILQEYIPSPIQNFVVTDQYGFDLTDDIVTNPNYSFIVVSYDLNRASKDVFERTIKSFAAHALNDGHSIIGITSSSFETVDEFTAEHNLPFKFYQSDERELKTIIRSNPGLVLLNNGKVLGKWHYRNIPPYEKISRTFF